MSSNTLVLTPIYDSALVLASEEDSSSIALESGDDLALELGAAIVVGERLPGGTTGQLRAKASNADYDEHWIDPPNGATNLSYSASPTGGTVASDTGNDAAIPLADGTNAGLMAPAEHTKLDGVAANATANATDAQLRDRATHTGVQAATTITEDSTHRFATDTEKAGWNAKQDALGFTPENVANKGSANGYASLDSGGQIPAAQIPSIAIVQYLGSVASQVAMLALVGQSGDWCVRSDSGTVWVITGSDPTQLSSWTQFTYPASPVSTVAGRVGDVTLTATDITDSTTVGRAVMTAANAAAGRTAFALGDSATKNVGTTAGTVAAGDDARFSSPWIEKTANYTAVAGNRIAADTAGSPFMITLPATPAQGDAVSVKVGSSVRTNTLTIARNGSTLMSLSEDMTVRSANAEFTLVYDGATWRL